MRNQRRSAVDAELQIGNDPTVWYFDPAGYDGVAAGLAQPGAPFVVEVVAPLAGRLILNPVAAGKVALTLPVKPIGWNPSGICLPISPLLYVSSVTGPTHDSPGYTLTGGYDLATLEQDIIDVMTGRTMLTVTLEARPSGQGVLALSGATLAYAVLCPAVPQR
jgi:hypothetical protein